MRAKCVIRQTSETFITIVTVTFNNFMYVKRHAKCHGEHPPHYSFFIANLALLL